MSQITTTQLTEKEAAKAIAEIGYMAMAYSKGKQIALAHRVDQDVAPVSLKKAKKLQAT